MRKQLLMALAALLMLPAFAASAQEARRIYALGFNNEWYPPTTANADWQDHYNDSNSLFETLPGSNVYEGELAVTDHSGNDLYFRFIYALSDSDNPAVYWRSNVICPLAPNRDGKMPERLGTSGAYKVECDKVALLSEYDDAGAWKIPSLSSHYNVRVDLNQNLVWIIPARGWLKAIDNAIPTLETLERFAGVYASSLLMPGDHTLKIYDLETKQFIAPAEDVELNWKGNTDWRGTEVAPGNTGSFVVKNWPGGTIYMNYQEFDGRASVEFNTTAKFPMEAYDRVYGVGDFCSWDLYSTAPEWAANADKTVYAGTLPVGTTMFKFAPERSWDVNYGWDGKYDFTPEGYLKMGIAKNADNFYLKAPLPADATVKVDRVNNCVIIEAVITDVYGNPGLDPVPDGKPHAPKGDNLWLVKADDDILPDATNIDYVWQHIMYVSPSPDGLYSCGYGFEEGKDFFFVKEFGPTYGENTVLAPQSPRSLNNRVNGTFISSYIETKAADACMWNVGYNGGAWSVNYRVTVDPTTQKITFYAPSLDRSEPRSLYLVGSPQDWNINESNMVLKEVAPNVYYGAFDIPGDSYFRFYSSLGDWESGSYGAQWDDIPVDFFFTGEETSAGIGNGKGSWHMTGWDGGTMYMLVYLDRNYVVFSASPIDHEEAPAAPVYDLYMCGPTWMAPNGLMKDEDGLIRINGLFSRESEIRLYTKLMPMAYDEPECHSSYALSMLDEVRFDEANEAKVRFDVIDEETPLQKAKHLVLPQNVVLASVTVDLDAKELTVKGLELSGVEAVGAEDAPEAYYNLQGVRVSEPTDGVYIRVRGGKAEKVVVRK